MIIAARTKSQAVLIGLPLGLVAGLWASGPSLGEFRAVLSGPQEYADRFGPDAFAVLVVAALLWVVASWLALACLAMLASSMPGFLGSLGHSVSNVITPALLRRAAVAAVGVGILTAAPAHATSSAVGSLAPTTQVTVVHAVDEVTEDPDLDWPAASDQAPATAEVVVQTGDCLWDIVSARLPPGASATQIANEVLRWWKANEDVVGDNPNLLLPGQALQPPAATS